MAGISDSVVGLADSSPNPDRLPPNALRYRFDGEERQDCSKTAASSSHARAPGSQTLTLLHK
jgi:hypothetical protein